MATNITTIFNLATYLLVVGTILSVFIALNVSMFKEGWREYRLSGRIRLIKMESKKIFSKIDVSFQIPRLAIFELFLFPK